MKNKKAISPQKTNTHILKLQKSFKVWYKTVVILLCIMSYTTYFLLIIMDGSHNMYYAFGVWLLSLFAFVPVGIIMLISFMRLLVVRNKLIYRNIKATIWLPSILLISISALLQILRYFPDPEFLKAYRFVYIIVDFYYLTLLAVFLYGPLRKKSLLHH